MTQKIDPFIKLNWGWDTGEGGWGEGVNQNLITLAFLQNKRIDSVISSASLLPPTPVDGAAYFAVADTTIYLRAEGSWYTLLPTIGMEFILKATEETVKFNGTTLVTSTKLVSEITGLQAALDSKVDESSVGAVSGIAPLGVDGKVPSSYLPASGSYLGTWNATTNTPTIVSGVGNSGEFYKVSQGGTVTIDGVGTWTAGDEIRFNGTVWQRVPNTNTVASVNGQVGTVVLTATDVGAAPSAHSHSNATTSVSGFMSSLDKTKLDGVATGATANSPDATLLARANHTGTQAQSTITNLVSDLAAKQNTLVSGTTIKTIDGVSILGAGNITTGTGGSSTFTGLTDTPSSYATKGTQFPRVNAGETALEFVPLGTAAFNNSGDFANSSHTHSDATTSVSGFMSSLDKTKLDGVATGATANSSDATLLSRSNHTGTQPVGTITGLGALATLSTAPIANGGTGATDAATARSNLGLGNVDNTTDLSKPISTATQAALNGKQALDADLTSIAALDGVGFAKRTGANAWTLDTSTYLTGINSGNVTTALGYTPANKAGETFTGDVTFNTAQRTTHSAEYSWSWYAQAGAYRAVDIIFDNYSIWGTLELTLTSFYSNGNYNGFIKANLPFGFAAATDYALADTSPTYNVTGNIRLGYSVTEPLWDSTRGKWVVRIVKLTNLENPLWITAKCFGSDAPVLILSSEYAGSVIPALPLGITGSTIKGDGGGVEGSVNNATPAGYFGGSLIATNSAGNIPTVSFHSYGSFGGAIQMTSGGNFSFKGSDGVTAAGVTAGGATFTGKPIIRFNAGATPTYSSGHLELSNAGSTNPIMLGFNAEGQTAAGLVHISGAGGLKITDGSVNGLAPLYASVVTGTSFSGNGANLTAINASNISSGTLNSARLPFSYSTASTPSTVVQRDTSGDIYAATLHGDNFFGGTVSVTSVYGDFYGNGSDITNLNASNLVLGTVPDARLSSNVVTKEAPSQLFQSLGTINGTVTVNGANGTHVLATVNGNTTWTFPTPSATEALALTLELTNGGAYTMTWPSGTRWAGGVAPTLTASGTDIIVFTKAGTNNWRGYLSSKDSK